MLKNRKEARDRVQKMRTVDEFEEFISALKVTEEDREIARMVFLKGWTRQKIAFEMNMSTRTVNKRIAKIYDLMA